MITVVLPQTTDLHPHGNTAVVNSIPTVLPSVLSPLPRDYRRYCSNPITVQLIKMDFIRKMTFMYDPLEAAVLSTMFSVVLLVQETVMKNKNLHQICVKDSCTRQLVQVSTACVAGISVFFNKKLQHM